jgi:hypothetical protein
MSEMNKQFSVRQLLTSMIYFAMAFAVAGSVLHIWREDHATIELTVSLIGFFGSIVVTALFGAGIGHLMGDTRNGFAYGIAMGGILYLLYTVQQALIALAS